MTTLVLVHNRLIGLPVVRKWAALRERFILLNHRGIATLALCAAIALGLVASVAMRYWTAGAGFRLQVEALRLLEARDELTKAELALRAGEEALSESDAELIAGMEKITTIRYVTPESVASSFSVSTP